MKTEERLMTLERKMAEMSGSTAQGTNLGRVIMDVALARKHDRRARGGESVVMWCLSLGPMSERKMFVYSSTIIGCIRQAEEKLRRSKR
jgi:hypothetical protein